MFRVRAISLFLFVLIKLQHWGKPSDCIAAAYYPCAQPQIKSNLLMQKGQLATNNANIKTV